MNIDAEELEKAPKKVTQLEKVVTGVLFTRSQDFLLEEVVASLEECEYLLERQHLEIAGLRESQ